MADDTKKREMGRLVRNIPTLGKIAILIVVYFITLCLFLVLLKWNGNAVDIIINMVADISGIVIIIFVFDRMLAEDDERSSKKEELEKILRFDRILQIVIRQYIIRKYELITPIENRHKLESSPQNILVKFDICDMKDMFSASLLISDIMQTPAGSFLDNEEKLVEQFERMISNIDFRYYPELSAHISQFISSHYECDVNGAIRRYPGIRVGDKTLADVAKRAIENTQRGNEIPPPSSAQYNIYTLRKMIILQGDALSKYIERVDELKNLS